MARASANRGRRPRPNARARGREQRVAPTPQKKKAASYEDQLFFTRLRRHQKWVFLFLAGAFALGFIVLGVGSGNGFLADAIRGIGGNGPSSIQSVEDAQKNVDKNPNDPQALLGLATALQADAKPKEAIDVLKRYVELRPDDADALRQLASLYDIQAAEAQRRAAELEAQGAAESIEATAFAFPGSSGFLGAVGQDPIDQARSFSASAKAGEARAEAEKILKEQVPVYEQLIALTPDEPILYIQLGQAATGAGEQDKAIAAFQKFLELAPDDPSAPAVKQQLQLLGVTSDTATG